MSPQELDQRRKQVADLAQKLSATADGEPHSVMLEALLTLYTAVSEVHSCCTSHSAQAALLVHQRLARAALERPADAQVH